MSYIFSILGNAVLPCAFCNKISAWLNTPCENALAWSPERCYFTMNPFSYFLPEFWICSCFLDLSVSKKVHQERNVTLAKAWITNDWISTLSWGNDTDSGHIKAKAYYFFDHKRSIRSDVLFNERYPSSVFKPEA